MSLPRSVIYQTPSLTPQSMHMIFLLSNVFVYLHINNVLCTQIFKNYELND
jgi:hypothetical protein